MIMKPEHHLFIRSYRKWGSAPIAFMHYCQAKLAIPDFASQKEIAVALGISFGDGHLSQSDSAIVERLQSVLQGLRFRAIREFREVPDYHALSGDPRSHRTIIQTARAA